MISLIPPSGHTEQKRYLRKNRQNFGPEQLVKFQKWFTALDSNDNGQVSVDELSTVFLSAGIMKRKKEIINMFKSCDIDNSKELSFDEFVIGVKNMTTAGKLKYDKLDALVDEANSLSAATILSQQRRNLLMHHVVTGAKKRQQEVDNVWAASLQRRGRDKRISYFDLKDAHKEKKSLEAVSRSHSKYMQKAKDVVTTLEPLVSQTTCSVDTADKAPKLRHQLSQRSMDLIEDIISPGLLSLADPTKCAPEIIGATHSLAPLEEEAGVRGVQLKSFEPQSNVPSDLPVLTPPRAARQMPQLLGHDSGKVKLVRTGFAVDMASPTAERFAIRDRIKMPLSTVAPCRKSNKIQLGSIRTCPISTKERLQNGTSKFYASKQNKYSLRRSELPK